MTIKGTKDDDNLTGTSENDRFNLGQGGSDAVDGGDGNDLFVMGPALNSGDRLEGGEGKDTLLLKGDYTQPVYFEAETVKNIEVIRLTAGFSYSLVTNDGNLSGGQHLTINASALSTSDRLNFDGSAEMNGRFIVYGGAGDDMITGGARQDHILIDQGGNDVVHAGPGDDLIDTGAAFGGDTIDGGAGFDTLTIDVADVSFSGITNVERIVLGSGGPGWNTVDDSCVGPGATLIVDGSGLPDNVGILGSGERDGHLILIGGLRTDFLCGGGSSDILTGNGNLDVFQFPAASDSTGSNYDTITDMHFVGDLIELDSGFYAPDYINGPVNGGELNAGATFDTDLATAIGAAQLSLTGCVLFTPDSGTLAGHSFFIINQNKFEGYQAGMDFVIDVTGYTGTPHEGGFFAW